MRYSNNHIRYY